MLVRYRGKGTKKYQYFGDVLEIPSDRWFSVSKITLFKELKRYPQVFDTVSFFNLKPFEVLGSKLSFSKDLIFTSDKPAIRKLKKIPFVRLQAVQPEKGIYIFKITNYNNSCLPSCEKIDRMVNVLVYRQLGGLGDIILTFPVVEWTKRNYPHYKITYACPEQFMSLAENNPYIDRVVPMKEQEVLAEDWDLTVDLTADCINYEVEHQPDVELNRSEIFMQKCGYRIEDTPKPKIYLSEEEIARAREEVDPGRLKIGLVLKANAPVRGWGGFKELRRKLICKYPEVQILEFCVSQPVGWESEAAVLPVFGRSLREVAALLYQCDVVISPDTGLAHMASALRVPTVWIFTHIDGGVRVKNYDNVWFLQETPEGCPEGKPCWYKISCSNNQGVNVYEKTSNPVCAQVISVDKVVKVVKEVLSCPNLSYCVVFHDKEQVTRQCLEKIHCSRRFNEEVILVDNGSSEGVAERLVSYVNILHKNSENLGCVKARNQAMKMASGRFVLTLDNDQYLSLKSTHALFQEEGDLVGVEAWSMDDKGYAFDIGENKGPLAYVGAGGMLIKSQIAKTLGYFDEVYSPAWFEDPDFCFRAVAKNYTLGYSKTAEIQHLAHQTIFSQKTFNSQEIWKQNHKFFVKRWYGNVQERELLTDLSQNSIQVPVPYCRVLLEKPKLTIVLLSWLRVELLLSMLEYTVRNSLMPLNICLMVQGAERLTQKEKKEIKKLTDLYAGCYGKFVKGNHGTAPQRKFLIDKAREKFDTQYLIMMDDDVVVPRGGLASLVTMMDRHKEYSALSLMCRGLNYSVFVSADSTTRIPFKAVPGGIVPTDLMGSATMILRKEVFDSASVDPEYKVGLWDYDLCMQMIKAGGKLGILSAKKPVLNLAYGSKEYKNSRHNQDEIEKSKILFHKKWGFSM